MMKKKNKVFSSHDNIPPELLLIGNICDYLSVINPITWLSRDSVSMQTPVCPCVYHDCEDFM